MTRTKRGVIGLGIVIAAALCRYYWRPIVFFAMILLYELVMGVKHWMAGINP